MLRPPARLTKTTVGANYVRPQVATIAAPFQKIHSIGGRVLMDHEFYMNLALDLAREAAEDGEAPVGCVIVSADGVVIGRGRNRREKEKSALAHAEIEAIDEACRAANDWRLDGCSLYVTLEPCPMCAGAVIMSRVHKVFYGAGDELTGSCGSVINLFMESYGQRTQVTGGILTDECSALLTGFFRGIRGSNATSPLRESKRSELATRKQNRLKNYVYSQNGTYFITICIKNRECLFGEIILPQSYDNPVGAISNRPPHVDLSENGIIVETAINMIPNFYKNVVVDRYVIMPNHVHLLISIKNGDDNIQTHGRLVIAPTTISVVVKELKSYVSKQIGYSIWQKSFHDHIIRDEKDYIQIANYIDNNPANWEKDRFYDGVVYGDGAL